MDAVEWNRCAGAGRVDLGSMALELRLGHRHPGRGQSGDDRHNAPDVWSRRTQAGPSGDRLTLKTTTRGPGPGSRIPQTPRRGFPMHGASESSAGDWRGWLLVGV